MPITLHIFYTEKRSKANIAAIISCTLTCFMNLIIRAGCS